MTLDDVKNEIQKYVYMEDTTMIDVSLASIIANRLHMGTPVWLIIVGASSGGKSQILKPLALSDSKYMHRVDDLTENTFLSGANLGKDKQASLLLRIGHSGMLVISDMTVLFSRGVESRNAILSQFRMLYDGEMSKHVGTSDKPVVWKGHLGIVAGSTPSIYRHMEDVADMGERFMYWRMHQYDERKATQLALSRNVHGNDLDKVMADTYSEYIQEVVKSKVKPVLTEEDMEHIIDISILAEKMRTVTRPDRFSHTVEYIPTTAFPMRTALQLRHIGEALSIMYGGEIGERGRQILRWLGWSLANEEKRRCLEVLVSQTAYVTTGTIADEIGLETSVTRNILQALSSVGLVIRSGSGDGLMWKMKEDKDTLLILSTLQGKNWRDVGTGRDATHEEVELDDEIF